MNWDMNYGSQDRFELKGGTLYSKPDWKLQFYKTYIGKKKVI